MSSVDGDLSSSSSSSEGYDSTTDKPKVYIPWRYFKKRNQYESNWWIRYLATDEIRSTLSSDATHRDTKEFKGLFWVDYVVFKQLKDLYLHKGWYDPNCKDICGNKCSDIELLILGALHTLGHAATRTVLQSNTNIDKEVHRLFFWTFCSKIASLKDEYIYLP